MHMALLFYTTISIRLVKDELCCVVGVMKFEINRDSIVSVKSARAKYFADLEAKKETELKNMREKEKLRKEKEEKCCKKSQLEEVNSRIKQTEIYLKSAEESILKGNEDLKKLFWEKGLNRNAIQQAQALIDM